MILFHSSSKCNLFLLQKLEKVVQAFHQLLPPNNSKTHSNNCEYFLLIHISFSYEFPPCIIFPLDICWEIKFWLKLVLYPSPKGLRLDYVCRLGSLGNTSTALGSRDRRRDRWPELQDIFFPCPLCFFPYSLFSPFVYYYYYYY